MHVNRRCNSWRHKCDHDRRRQDFEIKDLIIEIQHIWKEKAKLIPVTTGTNGTISKSLGQYHSNIPAKHKFRKTSHIGHCTHAMENANVNVQNILHRQNITLHVAEIVNTEEMQHGNVVYCR